MKSAEILLEQIKEDIVSTVSTIKEERDAAKSRINPEAIIYNLFKSEKYKFSYSQYQHIINSLYQNKAKNH